MAGADGLSTLTLRTPGGGAPADRILAQRSFVFRAIAYALPAFVEKPVGWRVAEIFTDLLECLARDKADFAPELLSFRRLESNATTRRCDSGTPKNLVGHPISDSGKALLN